MTSWSRRRRFPRRRHRRRRLRRIHSASRYDNDEDAGGTYRAWDDDVDYNWMELNQDRQPTADPGRTSDNEYILEMLRRFAAHQCRIRQNDTKWDAVKKLFCCYGGR